MQSASLPACCLIAHNPPIRIHLDARTLTDDACPGMKPRNQKKRNM